MSSWSSILLYSRLTSLALTFSMKEELDFTTAALVRLASHAFWINVLFSMNIFTFEERRHIVARLEELTRSTVSPEMGSTYADASDTPAIEQRAKHSPDHDGAAH